MQKKRQNVRLTPKFSGERVTTIAAKLHPNVQLDFICQLGGIRLRRTCCRSSDTHQSRQHTPRAAPPPSIFRDPEGECRTPSTAVAIRPRPAAYTMTLPTSWPGRLLLRPKRTQDCNHLSIRTSDAGIPEASPMRIHPTDRCEPRSRASRFSSCTPRRQRPDQIA
jgi:hypothetical protein